MVFFYEMISGLVDLYFGAYFTLRTDSATFEVLEAKYPRE